MFMIAMETTSKLRGVINEVQIYNSDDQIRLIGAVEQSYNDDGYLVEKKLPNGDIYSFEYGTLGELKKIITPPKTIEYLHNANNQRVAKKLDGVIVEKYLWANLTTLLAIYDGSDNLVQRFEYADSRMPITLTQNGSKYYLHYDQVGSLRAVSDGFHNIIKEIVYDTYGNILSDSNSSLKVPFGFASGLYDRDTKLTRFGYRDYDAYTGKWTAKDPIDFGGGDSNLYGYVLGDPVGGFDPSGLVDVNSGGGFGVGFMAGFGGANYHEHVNCSSNGCVQQTIICGRLGLGIHLGGGAEGNAGINPNGTYGEDCDGDNKECTYDWSVGLGGELQFGVAGTGGSVAGGSSGFGAIMDLFVGVGLGAGAGVEVCVIKSCPFD